MEKGRFREDLYYRISEVTIPIPPLRARHGDASLLAHAFLEKHAEAHSRNLRGFTDEALTAIEAYPWPGNARELENRVKRAAVMAKGNVVTAHDLELPVSESEPMPLNLREVREEAERQVIKRALLLCHGRVSQAADMLGVSRPTLYQLMEKYDLK